MLASCVGDIDLAAANDAIIIALCSKAGVPADNDERMMYCQEMLEKGMIIKDNFLYVDSFLEI